MLDLSLFRRRLFSAAAASAVLNFLCVYGILFLLPFYLIQGRDLTPAQAGLLITVQPLVMIVVAPLSETLSDRIGSRLPARWAWRSWPWRCSCCRGWGRTRPWATWSCRWPSPGWARASSSPPTTAR